MGVQTSSAPKKPSTNWTERQEVLQEPVEKKSEWKMEE
jgi:hypothetical protein